MNAYELATATSNSRTRVYAETALDAVRQFATSYATPVHVTCFGPEVTTQWRASRFAVKLVSWSATSELDRPKKTTDADPNDVERQWAEYFECVDA